MDCDRRDHTKRRATWRWGAHLTALDANISVRIAGVEVPAKVLKQGSPEDVDLSLLQVDEQKLPASQRLPRMQLCEAPPWPGDPVIVVDVRRARSHTCGLPYEPNSLRSLVNVSTTGNPGSVVFDLAHRCLLGIISGKFTSHSAESDRVVRIGCS